MTIPNAEYPTPDPEDYDLDTDFEIDPDAPDPEDDNRAALPYIDTLSQQGAESDRVHDVDEPEATARSMEAALRGSSVTGPYFLVDRRPEHPSDRWTPGSSRFLRHVFASVGPHVPQKKRDGPST